MTDTPTKPRKMELKVGGTRLMRLGPAVWLASRSSRPSTFQRIVNAFAAFRDGSLHG